MSRTFPSMPFMLDRAAITAAFAFLIAIIFGVL
jgi:hypothetical protein